MSKGQEVMRAEFEAWLRTDPAVLNIGFRKDTQRYLLDDDQAKWEAWQAASQQAPAEQEPAFWIDPLELHWIAEPLASLNCYPKPLDGLMPIYLNVQAAPQPEQSELVEALRGVLSAEHLEHAQAIANSALGRYWAALSAQGSAAHE